MSKTTTRRSGNRVTLQQQNGPNLTRKIHTTLLQPEGPLSTYLK